MPSENLPAFWILIMNIKQISSLFFLAGFSLTVHSEPATLEYAPRGEWLRIANEICRYYHQGQRQEQCWSSFNTLLQERQECEESYHDTPWRCTSHFDGLMWRWELDERKDSKQSSVSTQPVTTNRAIDRTTQMQSNNVDCTYMSCNYRNAVPKTPSSAKSSAKTKSASSDSSSRGDDLSATREGSSQSTYTGTGRSGGQIKPNLYPDTSYELEHAKLPRPQAHGIRKPQELAKPEGIREPQELRRPQELRKPQELGQSSIYDGSVHSLPHELEYSKMQNSQ